MKFFVVESVKHLSKHQDDVLEKNCGRTVERFKIKPKELAERLQTSLPSIQRAMNRLKESRRIVRKGGKQYGYWKID